MRSHIDLSQFLDRTLSDASETDTPALPPDEAVIPGYSQSYALTDQDREESSASSTPSSSAGNPLPQPRVVGETSVRKILEKVMTAWVSALIKEDFTDFHKILAASWQKSESPAQLKASYAVLIPYKDNLDLFPTRGKLVLLESRPFTVEGFDVAEGVPTIRDSPGPESPWQVSGEWRVNKTALGFTLVIALENDQWSPTGLRVEIF
ncbi:MAG: hypothetical protein LBS44_04955 [Deltaproteobacteria bacterium]|nr:hypothetical protein [Deltaproteobacteria bacterium]